MICPNCHAENEDSCEHCQNCGYDLITEPAAGRILQNHIKLVYSSLLGGKVEIDEATEELTIEKRPLVGLRRTHKRIPLSQIEAVCFYCSGGGGGPGGSSKSYHCELSVGGIWESLIEGGNEGDVLRAATTLGLRLEDREEKLRELADHLSKLFWVTATVEEAESWNSEKHRTLSHSIALKTATAGGWEKTFRIKMLRVEGVIRLQGHVVDSVEVLYSGGNTYYVLGYVIGGKTVDSVRTHRRKRYRLFGDIVDVKWRGGPLADQLNRDLVLREALLGHLGDPDCDANVTADEGSGSTMIIFGDSYPRQWVRLPNELFPTEARTKAVTLLGEKVRNL